VGPRAYLSTKDNFIYFLKYFFQEYVIITLAYYCYVAYYYIFSDFHMTISRTLSRIQCKCCFICMARNVLCIYSTEHLGYFTAQCILSN
jgi:hypothetical protein